jgi:hypothetical protein
MILARGGRLMDETLINQVAMQTGLNQEQVQKILKSWVMDTGRSPQDLGLEDLREVLVHILQNLFQEIAEGENKYVKVS